MSEPMRSGGHLHVISTLDVGGAELTLYRLLRASRTLRARAHVVSLLAAGEVGERLRGLGVPVTSLGVQRGLPSPLPVLSLVRLMRRMRPAVIQSWLYHADLIALLARDLAFPWPRSRPPVYWNLRTSTVDLTRYSRALAWVMRAGAWLSPRPDAVVVNSREGRDAHEAFGYRPRRWVVIPNGVDTSEFAPRPEQRARVRAHLALGPEAVLVGIFGRRDPMKEQQSFVQALVPAMYADPRVHALGVGRDLEGVMTFPADLRERVHLPGQQADVASWMNACEVIVSTSSSEGFPNVIAEAMSCGRACVVTPSGSVTELVDRAGIVLPDQQVAALEAALRTLVADAALRERLGNAARSRIVAEFGIDRMVARYDDLYRQGTADAAAGRGNGIV